MPGTAFSGAVEGPVDEAVLRCVIASVGGVVGPIHGRNGKAQLLRQVGGYNNAARFSPWVVLVDLDDDAGCAPPLIRRWLPDPAPQMLLRVAVRETEAWLLADRERLAVFLGVPVTRVPHDPESLPDPKRAMVTLAGQSRRSQIRQDMVPRPSSGRMVGPAYTSRLIEFVTDRNRGWRPAIAADASRSLRRCMDRMTEMMERAGGT